MKNIHILPTDKPSKKGDIIIWNGLKIWNGIGEPPHHNQNIYITSDEEIKEGDWFAVQLFKVKGESIGMHIEKCIKLDDDWCNDFDEISIRYKGDCQKIILTTDQSLDGVQAIDDEFLEWFVKNPSCERVEVESKVTKDGVWTDLKGYVELPTTHSIIHKIIIPKEIDVLELGQIIPKEKPYSKVQQKSLELNKKFSENSDLEKIMSEFDEPKQETLEEFANKTYPFYGDVELREAIELGAKWQQEQDKNKYSEEDLHNAFYNGWLYRGEEKYKFQFPQAKKEWFEQNKKK